MKARHYAAQDWRTRALDALTYGLAWTVHILTRPFPLWPLEDAAGWVGGRMILRIARARARVERNLDLVKPHLGPTERQALILGAGASFARLMAEYSQFDRFVRDVEIEADGIERLREAAARGNGVLLVTGHYGNWEAARIAARRAGLNAGIIYRAFNNRYVNRKTPDVIGAAGTPVLTKGPAGVRQMMQTIAQGGIVMVLVDQRNSGAPVIPFLGQPAETVTIVADIARRTGAAVLPVVARRNVAARRFDVTFEEPVAPAGSTEMMAEVNARIGAWIEADPTQWLWFHRRWRLGKRVWHDRRSGRG